MWEPSAKLFSATISLGRLPPEMIECTALNTTFSTGTFTTLDDPLGLYGTQALGVSSNYIVGCYYDSQGAHGFYYDGSTYTTLDDPNGFGSTYAFGVSGNTVVGQYQDGSGWHGFVATVPEPSTLTVLAFSAVGFLVYGLWRRLRKRHIAVTASEESPAILSFPCRSFEAKRRAA